MTSGDDDVIMTSGDDDVIMTAGDDDAVIESTINLVFQLRLTRGCIPLFFTPQFCMFVPPPQNVVPQSSEGVP